MVILRIKKKEFELIKNGLKKSEWRSFSAYNQKIFGEKDEKKSEEMGKPCFRCKNIKEILLINGYTENAPKMIIYPSIIQLVKFSKEVFIKNDNFHAEKGDMVFEIKINKIKLV